MNAGFLPPDVARPRAAAADKSPQSANPAYLKSAITLYYRRFAADRPFRASPCPDRVMSLPDQRLYPLAAMFLVTVLSTEVTIIDGHP